MALRDQTKFSVLPWLRTVPSRLRRVTLLQFIITIVLISILVASSAVGFFAIREVYRQKLQDSWAIMFLSNERLGDDLRRETADNILHRGAPKIAVAIQPGSSRPTVLSGRLPEQITWRALGIPDPQKIGDSHYFTSYGGVTYQVAPLTPEASSAYQTPQAVGLWPVDLSSAIEARLSSQVKMTVYVLNREGAAIFVNRPELQASDLLARPAAQHFIKMPLRQSQHLIHDESGRSLYAFYQEIAGTNLVLFAEVLESEFLAPIKRVGMRFLAILVIILVAALSALALPLRAIGKPIADLLTMVTEVGRGNFNVARAVGGFGEIKLLSDNFAAMTDNLVKRDATIQQLMVHQVEKARMEAELGIARNIQHNFLCKPELPPGCGIELRSVYHPASEVAGDWFGYDYDPASRTAVVAIADVSGHGTGSSMFTAVIAGVFDQFIRRHRGSYPADTFIHELHETVRRLGRDMWHATIAVVRIEIDSARATFHNAGHCFPLVVDPTAKEMVYTVKTPSSPIGMSPAIKITSETVAFPCGARLILFTDGLPEGSGPSGRPFGTKGVRNTCETLIKAGTTDLSGQLHARWKAHLNGQTGDDDICILEVQRL